MEMSLYSIAVEVFTRTNLMIALMVVTTIFNGLPNINLIILMAFLSSVAPLPTKPVINAIEVSVPCISVIFRFWLNVSLWLITMLLHPIMVVLNFLFFSLLEEGFQIMVNNIRSASRNLSRSVIDYGLTLFFVQIQLMVYFVRIVSSICEWFGVFITSLRFVQRIARLVLTVIYQSALFRWAEQKLFRILSSAMKPIFSLSFVFLVFPGPVAVGNYMATGQLYPGSIVRFKCLLTQQPEPLFKHSFFLENSFSSWTVLRTAHFFILTQALTSTHWTPTTHIVKLKQRLNSWLTVAVVAIGGVFFVLLFNNRFISQVLHIIVTVGSLAMFVLILDGYHQSHYLLTLYGMGTLLVIIQDALVVAYEVFSTISAIKSINLSLVVMSCLTLWICWSVSIDVCGRIVRKITNPRISIL